MFSVTFWSLHIGVDGVPAGHASSMRGDHPKVAASKTPAPLEAEYHVVSAKELIPLQVTGEWASI
jgi:hypothetical protein